MGSNSLPSGRWRIARVFSNPDDLFDSMVALDIKTGAIKSATKALPYGAWKVS